ncbi:MAG TPA: hypothetical protein VNK95_15670 [Caldilineaceae bacterium]|nr:hypothetical protein [Caldilineaceae bacterium]
MPTSHPTPRYTQRRTFRYKGYDYRRPGAYFVTICASKGRSVFGQVQDGVMVRNALGDVAHQCWVALPDHFPYVRLDVSIIMPNHMHGLLWLYPEPGEGSETQGTAPGTDMIYHVRTTTDHVRTTTDGMEDAERGQFGVRRFGAPLAGSLSTIIGSYKAAVTRTAHKAQLISAPPLWHGRFWDRIVRNDAELARIRAYIESNPARWQADQLHPQAPPNRFNRWDQA